MPTFIAVNRLQPSKGVKVHRRSQGLERTDWTVIDGFPVTSIERTAADLHHAGVDGGHLGRFIQDARSAGATDSEAIRHRIGIAAAKLDALIEMAEPTWTGH